MGETGKIYHYGRNTTTTKVVLDEGLQLLSPTNITTDSLAATLKESGIEHKKKL